MNIETMQANLLKALGHPIRLKIVKKLIPGSLCVCELNDDIEFSQSNLSQHLKILKEAGVLTSERDGLKIIYSIYNDSIKEIVSASYNVVKTNIEKVMI